MRTQTLTLDKRSRLLALGRKRKGTRWPGYNCIGDYHAGLYECDFVSPYSKTASNVDASFVVLLQDWSCDERLKGAPDQEAAALGYTPSLPTNVNLIELLNRHFGFELEDVFGTNVFPFVKLGRMNARIPQRDLSRAAEEFALPQIEILAPRTAMCLGRPAFNALRRTVGKIEVANLQEGIDCPFMVGSTEIWCQAHTGMLGKNNRNRGGVDRVNPDWARMAAAHNKPLQPAAEKRGG